MYWKANPKKDLIRKNKECACVFLYIHGAIIGTSPAEWGHIGQSLYLISLESGIGKGLDNTSMKDLTKMEMLAAYWWKYLHKTREHGRGFINTPDVYPAWQLALQTYYFVLMPILTLIAVM